MVGTTGKKHLILNQNNTYIKNCSLCPTFERIQSWRQILYLPTSDLFVTCTKISVTGALQLQNSTHSLHDYNMIDSSCSLTTVIQSCQRGLQTKCSRQFCSFSGVLAPQPDIWSGWCFVAPKEALSGTALLPKRRRKARRQTSAFQLTSSCSTSSLEGLAPERQAPQLMTHNYLQWQLTMAAAIRGQAWHRSTLLVGPEHVRSGLGLQVFSDSINKKLFFSSCQTKEPSRLNLTLILAHNCRRDLSFQTQEPCLHSSIFLQKRLQSLHLM